MKKFTAVVLMLIILLLTACTQQNTANTATTDTTRSDKNFVVLSGSENKSLEPMLVKYGQDNGFTVKMKYMGSVDVMNELSKPNPPYDAVWVANDMWISMGDTQHIVKSTKSIMVSPVTFGVKESVAKSLGWVGRDVKMADILDAIKKKKLSFAMTSATQSNSGASALFGFMNAFLGNPDVITQADLQKTELKQNLTVFLSGINRSSGSSDWLKDLFLKSDYDAMVNYESVLLETNTALVKQNREPLHIIYPVDGLSVADYPLGFIMHKDDSSDVATKKEQFFNSMQTYLLSKDTQKQIADLGRRSSEMGKVSKDLYNPNWGVDLSRTLTPIRYPSADVIRAALALYQSELRKPSITYYLLDYSGSMSGDGEAQLKKAMEVLLDQTQAKANMLQMTDKDKIVVVPFNGGIIDTWRSEGTKDLGGLLSSIKGLNPGGGTDMYAPTEFALKELGKANLDGYMPSIVIMTDGRSNNNDFSVVRNQFKTVGKDIPIFSITFGDADASQLNDLADLSRARVFEGKTDLVGAFKTARGYN